MTDNLFNRANKLKSFGISINGRELIRDTIISAEFVYKNDTPVITGNIVINDLYDYRSLFEWEDSTVVITFLDIFDGTFTKEFKVIRLNDNEYGQHRKSIDIDLQDSFSYKLDHSYLSKSYNNTITFAIQDFISHLGFEDSIIEISEVAESKYFTVPKNISNLNFFIFELEKYGYVFYQTRDGVYIKSQTDIDVENLEENGIFTDQTDNQIYKNLIHKIEVFNNNRDLIVPKTRSIAYNADIKSVNRYSFNDKTRYSLNDKIADIQISDGFKDVYQQHLDFGKHDKMIRESFLKQYNAEAVVNGYTKNNVNQIYDLLLRGNVANVDSKNAGTVSSSGKYISWKVVDKLIGDHFIQKIHLERADTKEKI